MKKSNHNEAAPDTMREASEYAVQRVGDDTFEIWHDETLLATLSKKEAWPIMIGQVHPEEVVAEMEEPSGSTGETSTVDEEQQ